MRRADRLPPWVWEGLPWVLAAAWYAVIFALSAQTGSESGELSNQLVLWSLGLDWDVTAAELAAAGADLMSVLFRKGAHMGAYFVLTGLLAWCLRGPVKPVWGRCLGAAALCALLAGLDEWHQTFVPGRSGTLGDALIDLAGGICFLLAWLLVRALWRRRQAKKS